VRVTDVRSIRSDVCDARRRETNSKLRDSRVPKVPLEAIYLSWSPPLAACSRRGDGATNYAVTDVDTRTRTANTWRTSVTCRWTRATRRVTRIVLQKEVDCRCDKLAADRRKYCTADTWVINGLAPGPRRQSRPDKFRLRPTRPRKD